MVCPYFEIYLKSIGNEMRKYQLPDRYQISDLPEYQRLMAANPGERFKPNQIAAMYTKAIDWFAIIGTIWPDFNHIDNY
jgi:hypothetical protein